MPLDLTENQIGLIVYRLEAHIDEHPRSLQYHKLRKTALHEVLDGEPAWKVADWGKTDDTEPHECVDLILDLIPNFALAATAAASPIALYILKKLGDAALDITVIEPFKKVLELLISRLVDRQDDKKIELIQIQFRDGTFVNIKPPEDSPRFIVAIDYRSRESSGND